ncbi:MAG: hypothetical protein E7508_10650 [Ruminococcus sp.]|nr:hypothetical protein [Ruminococcus sp.]
MNKNKIIGLVSILAAIIGIIVIFTYRAWLGGVIYLVAGIMADIALRGSLKERTGEEYPNYVLAMMSEKKIALPKYVKDGMKNSDIVEKILSIMIVMLPVVIIVCVILWITWDTSRTVDDIYSGI